MNKKIYIYTMYIVYVFFANIYRDSVKMKNIVLQQYKINNKIDCKRHKPKALTSNKIQSKLFVVCDTYWLTHITARL